MKRILFLLLFGFSFLLVSAQQKDSVPHSGGPTVPSIFSNADTITTNDYLLSIEKVFQVLNKVPVLSQPVPYIMEINRRLDDDDSALAIIKDRLNGDSRMLNVRNLQMFSIILKQVNDNSKEYAGELNNYDSIYDSLRAEVIGLGKDTLIRKIVRDPALRDSFRTQLLQLRGKWKKADSIMRTVHLLINNTQARTSGNLITSNEMQLQAQSMMATTGQRIFSKESDYLWQF
jgi:hypothetical protein